jgi:diguanylate cyclase (GGDEF)-like protein
MHLARSEQSCELDERCQLRIANPESEIRWLEIGGVRFEFDGRPATLNFVDDVTERRRMDEKIRELAFHDTLTGLPNRRTVIDRLAQTIAANRRSGANAALMFMDLDNFKPLNDRHGHSVGDLLLIEVGHRLRACVREVDTVARFGGDEFAVLLIDLPADPTDAQAAARQLATRMLDSLSQPYRLRVGGRDAARTIEHVCTASIGVHLFGAGPAAPDELIDRADGAMYAAKHAGRHNVRFSGEAG